VPATGPATNHAAADRCPGVLRLVEAADGYLARIRLPGGLIGAGAMRALAWLASELGDGRLELTSRGNVQLRRLAADAAGPLTDELARAGLFPSPEHDRVRNVLASPLAGLDGGPDLTAIVQALDTALCARPRLAELPGRFLFAVDDGRGDVAGLGADVLARVRADGAVVNGLAVRGAATGHAGPGHPVAGHVVAGHAVAADVVTVMLACAEAFLDARAAQGGTAWRIADLADGPARVRAAVAARLGLAAAAQPMAGSPPPAVSDGTDGTGGTGALAAPTARPVGVVGPAGTAVVLLAPLGRLTAAQLTWLADRVGGRLARITPWRSVVLPDLPDAAGLVRDAADLGFGVGAESPWLRLSACAGRPGCASALADVQADAAGFAARWPERIVHVSGCARHCGRPAATQVDVTATSEGYQVAGI
jgi:precorrin-3B synthase